jgi:lipoprotein-releasing system permease protein
MQSPRSLNPNKLLQALLERSPDLHIAFTHLVARKRQTLVAVLGVMFGIATFIFQAGLITGFQTTFIEKTINTSAHIQLFVEPDVNRKSILSGQYDPATTWTIVRNQQPKDEKLRLKNGYQIVEDLEKDPRILGVSPFLGTQVIFKLGNLQRGGFVNGVNIEKENQLFHIDQYLAYGKIEDMITKPNAILMGVGLMKFLGAQPGDEVMVTSGEGISMPMRIVATMETGIIEADNNKSYISIKQAQKLLGTDGQYITDINLKLKNIDEAETLAKAMQEKYQCTARDWKTANADRFSVFKIQNIVTYLVIASILIVSGFGIFNIQMMIIYEKLGDIAILKAIGYKDKDIRTIFLTEAIVIGIIGGILGLIVGWALSTILGQIPLDIRGFVTMKYLVFNNSIKFYVFAFLFGLAATAIAGYLPARKAANIDPIDIIRGK